MKKLILIQFILFLGTTQVFSTELNTNEVKNPYDHGKLEIAEKQVSVDARIIKDQVYFRLVMLNEEKESAYSLVREYENGIFESVELNFGHKNEINLPLLYCFVDEEIPTVDFTYTLYRISDETKIIQKWKYCANEKEICSSEHLELAAK
ncbi:MAG: hypothetical protein QNL65_10660 [Opitutales bacterium]|jgi:hypothetical protein